MLSKQKIRNKGRANNKFNAWSYLLINSTELSESVCSQLKKVCKQRPVWIAPHSFAPDLEGLLSCHLEHKLLNNIQ